MNKKKLTPPPPQVTNKTGSSKPQSDVKGINVQQKNDPLSKRERMKQFSIKIKKENKNLKKEAKKKGEQKGPSAQDKMKEFNKNIVSKKFENMKTDNVFDASKQIFVPGGVHKNADNSEHKPYNTYDESPRTNQTSNK